MFKTFSYYPKLPPFSQESIKYMHSKKKVKGKDRMNKRVVCFSTLKYTLKSLYDIQTWRLKVEGMNYKCLYKREASIIILFVVNWKDSLHKLFLICALDILLKEKGETFWNKIKLQINWYLKRLIRLENIYVKLTKT